MSKEAYECFFGKHGSWMLMILEHIFQGEQVCQLLEEKRQQHSRALLAAIEEGISRRFRDKELEMENMKRQNLELAEHVKQLSIKVHNWQAKARANEAMVTALKSNLQQAQQAVALSLEQSKEGCGDSEADDAASSHHGDDDAHARTFKENRELREQRTCRVCRCNDVSILLLPCRHLCLCKECEARLDACPLCRSLKNASVQVYMS
jgi:E3 ubiquitin-protein ligase BOI-like protein